VRRGLPPIVVGLALLAGWQAVHRLAGSDTVVSPASTLTYLVRLMHTARFWQNAEETGLAFLWALALSAVFGVALGVALGLSRPTGEVLEPILVSFYALPKVTLYPLVLLAFGLGLSARVAFGVMHGLVPIALLTRAAIGRINPVYWRTARTMRLGRAETIRRIMLPAIAPDLLGALRIGLSLSLLGVTIGEMFASKRGLGFAAMNAMGLGDIRTILAIGVFLAVVAIAANTLLLGLERAMRNRSAAR
jgi:NitT/TauT family transport system permease protein